MLLHQVAMQAAFGDVLFDACNFDEHVVFLKACFLGCGARTINAEAFDPQCHAICAETALLTLILGDNNEVQPACRHNAQGPCGRAVGIVGRVAPAFRQIHFQNLRCTAALHANIELGRIARTMQRPGLVGV
jgi:hypothetical protein